MFVRKSEMRFAKFTFVLLVCILLTFGVRYLQYSEDRYVCSHMARDVEDVLEFLGVDTQVVVGQNKIVGEPGHVWLRVNGVDIDSVWLIPWYWNVKEFQRDLRVYEDFSHYAAERDFPASKW